MSRIRLAVVVSHPIQYQAPLWRHLAGSDAVDLEVWFLSDHGVGESFDPGFGVTFAYDVPLLEGYPHRFLRNRSPRPGLSFAGQFSVEPARRLRHGAMDAVLVMGWAYATCWVAATAAKASRVPYVLRGETHPDGPDQRGMRRLAKRGLVGPLVRGAGAAAAIGRTNRAFYLSYGMAPDRIFDAPYSVDNAAFASAGAVGASERRQRLTGLGLDPDRLTVVVPAKLQPWKRPVDVARAAARCDQPVNVLFLGEGPERSAIEAVDPGRSAVRVLGFVNQSEMGRWLGAGDVVTLASDSEPWGLAVNEGMAAGLVPVVSEAVGCAADLVTSTTGRTFPVGGVDALAGALDALSSDPALLQRCRGASADRIGEYAIERTAAGIEAAVRRAVER